MKNPKLLEQWITALRGADYKQATGQLRVDDAYCCLGVLCDISSSGRAWSTNEDKQYIFTPEGDEDGVEMSLPTVMVENMGFGDESGAFDNPVMLVDGVITPYNQDDFIEHEDSPIFESLVDLNDSAGATFKEIAQFLVDYPEMVFND